MGNFSTIHTCLATSPGQGWKSLGVCYKIRQQCRSCMETMYTHYCLTKDYKCLLCGIQRTPDAQDVDCFCYCDQCGLGDYKCKCCRTCKKDIVYCLMHNRCRSLEEVQEAMCGLREAGKPLATQSHSRVVREPVDVKSPARHVDLSRYC